jgi:hypothetical protein
VEKLYWPVMIIFLGAIYQLSIRQLWFAGAGARAAGWGAWHRLASAIKIVS